MGTLFVDEAIYEITLIEINGEMAIFIFKKYSTKYADNNVLHI